MKIIKLWLFLLIGGLFLFGCTAKPGDLPTPKNTELPGDPVLWYQLAFFNTGQANGKATKEEDRPRVAVINSPEEISSIQKWIRTEHLPLIQNVDFKQFAVLVVFAGWQPDRDHDILVNHIVRNGNEVTVSVAFTELAPGEVHAPAVTSPYLVLEIQKSDLPSDPKYILFADRKEVKRYKPGG